MSEFESSAETKDMGSRHLGSCRLNGGFGGLERQRLGGLRGIVLSLLMFVSCQRDVEIANATGENGGFSTLNKAVTQPLRSDSLDIKVLPTRTMIQQVLCPINYCSSP